MIALDLFVSRQLHISCSNIQLPCLHWEMFFHTFSWNYVFIFFKVFIWFDFTLFHFHLFFFLFIFPQQWCINITMIYNIHISLKCIVQHVYLHIYLHVYLRPARIPAPARIPVRGSDIRSLKAKQSRTCWSRERNRKKIKQTTVNCFSY